MIRRVALVAIVACAALAIACSLNPQPLPPGSVAADPDASFDAGAGSDATVGPSDDAGMTTDAEADATREASPPGDGGTDGGSDAAVDADDASDGALDAQGD